MPRLAVLLLIAFSLGPVVAHAQTLDATPAPLYLGASTVGYSNEIHPIGWSADGRKLAFLVRRSGQSATTDGLVLRVQDLATDALVADVTLHEPDDTELDVAAVWAARASAVRGVLDEHGIAPAFFRLETFPATVGEMDNYAEIYDVRFEPRYGESIVGHPAVAGYRVVLRESRTGREKTIADYDTGDLAPYGAAVIGLLRAPTGDRLAVLVKELQHGFEGDRVQSYRFFGAGVGEAF